MQWDLWAESIMWTSFSLKQFNSAHSKDEKLGFFLQSIYHFTAKNAFVRYDTLEVGKYK